MPTWSRGERTVTTVRYTVPVPEPWGACWDEVQQALSAAIAEYNRQFADIPSYHGNPSSDSIRVHMDDDGAMIVISFRKE